MNDLDAVESHCGESLDPLVRSVLTRVRENGNAAAPVNQRNRFRNRDAALVEIRWPSCTEVPIECVTEVHRPSIFDERPSDVRPSYRRIAGHSQHVLESDTDAESVEQSDDAFRTFTPRVLEHDECTAHFIEQRDVQAEHMDLIGRFVGGQLDAGDELDAEPLRGILRLGDPLDCVVIGQRECLKSGVARGKNHHLWRVRSIGRRRMEVEIDWPRVPAGRGGARHGV
jgi:hypothetical protein